MLLFPSISLLRSQSHSSYWPAVVAAIPEPLRMNMVLPFRRSRGVSMVLVVIAKSIEDVIGAGLTTEAAAAAGSAETRVTGWL